MNKLQSNPKNVHSSTGTLIVLPGPLSGGDSMFHVPAIPDPSRCEVITSYAKGVAIFEPCVVQFVKRTRDQSAHELSALDRYVEGWAKADVDKICDASAPGYRFTDPLVGTYGRSSLHKYFDELRCRFSRIGTIGKDEF